MTLQIKDENGKVIVEKEVAVYNNMLTLKAEDFKKVVDEKSAPVIGAFH